VRQALRWGDDHLPTAVLFAAPGLVVAGAAWLQPDRAWQLTVGMLGGLVLSLTGAAVIVRSGWVSSWRELRNVTIGRLRRQRSALVQRTAVLQRVVDELRGSSERATGITSKLLSELVRAEETTRANLAAELHDTVAQCLSLALMGLNDVTESRHLEAREAVRDAELQLRTVLARIRPPELAGGDLAQAVADLCTDLDHRYGVEVEVRWAATNLRLPIAAATVVYRFLQETLLNAVEHADGEGVSLDLAVVKDAQGSKLSVTVSDHGPGFEQSAVVSAGGRHVGLKLARERARLAGGDLSVLSVLGEGTRVRLLIPLSWDVETEPLPVPSVPSVLAL
jgi:signal transduction histidine kinase